MSCMNCRWFKGTAEPTEDEKHLAERMDTLPDWCTCIAGVICPDIAEDDTERAERRLESTEYVNEVRGFNDQPDW